MSATVARSSISVSTSITRPGNSMSSRCRRSDSVCFRWLTAALPAAVVAACAGIGPATVPHDRIDYGSAIGDSWKEQTLLNIVKLRYGDMPIFLEVAQVIAGYQLQSAVTGSVTLGNFTANLIDRLTAAGTATGGSTYTDRPTVIYQPLTGVDFL